MKITNFVASGVLALGIAVSGLASASTSFEFSKITSNSMLDLSSQFLMEVSEGAGGYDGEVLFKFTNTLGTASSITDIYFDLADSDFFSSMYVAVETGVSFSMGANPGDLPGGNTIGFSADTGLTADSDSPVSKNGINATGDFLTLSGVLALDSLYANLIQNLSSGAFRVGLHVQAIADGFDNSDSYVTTAVPLPAAAWLFGSALLGFVGFASRRKA